ncbi:unnamed protein product (mitochondrion) [Plasmodiophora brassicae]|uniref:Ribosomal protein eL8/eL30/eS12/Gadd45 domain-containing protein n=1 Tax=Plasmodiophora brassicae TaxID=37360 RepID=A0A0G4IZP3_PLABS|nr:hypothetical protein PBRA_001751 [Plasmodiophora brassicae]SPQ93820.1 unnamed protein product [Plasmodiophora brassicae]
MHAKTAAPKKATVVAGRAGAMNAKAGTQKAAVVAGKARTMTKMKKGAAAATMKLSFKSPLAIKTHLTACDASLLNDLQTALQSSSKDDRRAAVVVGLNAVTKAMENYAKSIAVVVLCQDVTPAHLSEHLVVMCAVQNVACVAVACPSTRLGQCVGRTTALALAFRASQPATQAVLPPLLQRASVPQLPWLDRESPKLEPLVLEHNRRKRPARPAPNNK